MSCKKTLRKRKRRKQAGLHTEEESGGNRLGSTLRKRRKQAGGHTEEESGGNRLGSTLRKSQEEKGWGSH